VSRVVKKVMGLPLLPAGRRARAAGPGCAQRRHAEMGVMATVTLSVLAAQSASPQHTLRSAIGRRTLESGNSGGGGRGHPVVEWRLGTPGVEWDRRHHAAAQLCCSLNHA